MYLFTPLHMIRSNGQRAKRNTKQSFWRTTHKCNHILDSSRNTTPIYTPLSSEHGQSVAPTRLAMPHLVQVMSNLVP